MNFKEYLKQLSIVIFGILIAFWANNLAMQNNERSTRKQVFLTILNEVKGNNESVRNAISSLDSLSTTIGWVQDDSNLSDDYANAPLHYHGLRLTSIGYETAKYTGILKGVNHALISEIVVNYETCNSLMEFEKLLVNELLDLSKGNENFNYNYMLTRIDNFVDNLKVFEQKQDLLIANLSTYLKE